MDEVALSTISAIEQSLWVINKSLQELKKGLTEQAPPQMAASKPDISDVLDVDACAKLTKMSKSTLYKACANRTIPHFKSGKRNLFHRQQVVDWLLSNKIKTMDEIYL